MPILKLKLASDLGVNPETNAVAFKKSSTEGNTLEFREDGLYAEATQGYDGSGGTGYTAKGDYSGARVGYAWPYGMEASDRRVLLTNVVHRVYTADDNNINSLQGFRPEIDYVLPGDMVIYKNQIYLVTRVTQVGSSGAYGSPGNSIADIIGPLNE